MTQLDERSLPAGVRISTRAIDRHARAHDASHYLLIPQAIATPHTVDEVAEVLAMARRQGRTVTFRAGGTSLSGQSQTDSLLVDVRSAFRSVRIEGDLLVAGPGLTVARANAELARLGRKLGPDPASEIACTIGGIVANNSSGMSCGTHANPYATVDSLVVVLPSGTVIDTADPDADGRLRVTEPRLHAGLLRLRDQVRGDEAMAETIRHRFSMKNTMGYAVNAFLDYDRAVDILAHLMVGSEGTLGFVAEARFRTVPIEPAIATGLLVFNTLAGATGALEALVAAGLTVIELMDATSLKVAQSLPGTPAAIASLTVDKQAALLVEHHAADADALAAKVDALRPVLAALGVPAELTSDTAERAKLWKVRKGLYTSVAGARPTGTTALLEDIVVPVANLLPTCERLTELFAKHGFEESVIFGHARDGNIHFLINERFTDPAGLARHEAFTADMVDLVLSMDGNLKAEHGTGRIMAPYVGRQYGPEIEHVMREVKGLFDPTGILNPGVLLTELASDDASTFKLPVAVRGEIDRCVECGYCEPTCPSKDLTLTPRQRIVVLRDIEAAKKAGDQALAAELERDYEYAGIDTCAVDGMCGLACPVVINTGDLVRNLRAADEPAPLRALWGAAAKGWGPVTTGAAMAMKVARVMPAPLVRGVTQVARAVVGADTMPRYDKGLPGGGTRRTARTVGTGEILAVYMPACVQTMFGPEGRSRGVMQAFEDLLLRAGVAMVVPEGVGEMCCGTPWKSKGFLAGYHAITQKTLPALWEATHHGALPVVCDGSSCTEGLEVMAAQAVGPYAGLQFVDSVAFAAQELVPKVAVTRRIASIAVHPTCGTAHLGTTKDLLAICEAMSDDVVVPKDWGCCAFAGDRGMLHPELTASATAREAAEITSRTFGAYVSSNRTCEIGMTRATGRTYRHVLEVFEEATRPA